jgi:hypothetical protein
MNYTLSPIDDSLPYMQEQMRRGRGLAHLLVELDLTSGTVQAFLPADEPSRAEGYAKGALRDSEQEGEAVAALADYLVAQYDITREPAEVLICQFADGASVPPESGSHVSPSAREPWKTIWLSGAKRRWADGELWYVDASSDFDHLVKMLQRELWFPAICVLAQLPKSLAGGLPDEIEYARLGELLQEPQAILVGGWDAMNYLIWTPGSP